MMLRAILLVSLVAAPAAFAAGMWRGQNHTVDAPKTGVRINAPLVGKPGHGVSDAGKYFAALNAPPPPPPPPPLPAPPAPPPPPDVAVLFRKDLAAVISAGRPDARVVLSGSRALRPGEVYRDGWKLASLSSTTAVLTKGSEQRNIGLFSPPPSGGPTVVAAAPVPTLGPTLTFANSGPAGRPSGAATAGMISALRGIGMNQAQLDRIQSMISSGAFDRNSFQQMMMQHTRTNPVNMAQLNTVLAAAERAGIIQGNDVRNLQQMLPQQQNMQQIQQVMQLSNSPNNRPAGAPAPNNNAGRGPNGGFGGQPNIGLPTPPGRVGVFPPPQRASQAPSSLGQSNVRLEGRTLVLPPAQAATPAPPR